MSVYEATMPPQDPREQPVIDPWRATPESIAYAKHLAALERAQIDAIVRPLVHVCGWCSNARELTEAAIARGEDVSHGICEACMERVDEEYARTSDTNKVYVPGLVSFLINGEPVSKEEFERRFTDARAQGL